MLRYSTLVGLFALPFLPLLVTNSLFFPFITGKNFAFRIIVEIVFVLWALLAMYEPKYRPRFSFILAALVGWMGIVLAADLAGLSPLKSLWSNYERMEGFVAIFHVVLYVFVLGHMLTTEKLWNYFLNTTLAAAGLVSVYALFQLSGALQINQGGVRIDATLGNAAYFAVYMLFHSFIAVLMAIRAESRNARIAYGFLAVIFAALLILSGTRGTTLGLVGGSAVALGYVVLFSRGAVFARKVGLGALVALVLVVGLFITFRQAEVIKKSPTLARIANISLEAGDARFIIWGMAFEGVKERPILGWGQENFNYVFNKYYDERLHSEEPWFDRVHNIVFDWLIAAGVLGLISYFAIFFAALYYVAVRPRIDAWKKRERTTDFSVLEQGVLFGLLVGYMIHNLFVFDNIISYLFYGTILAYIHARVMYPRAFKENVIISPIILDKVVAPVCAVLLLATIYFVNVPALLAAGDIIKGFQSQTMDARLAAFKTALARGSFGDQEIREQLTRITQDALQQRQVPEDMKKKFRDLTDAELAKQLEATPNDARIRVFVASFYRLTGKLEEARQELQKALLLSPKKQQIMFETGLASLQGGETDKALEIFKEAHELAPEFVSGRMYYAGAALYAKNDTLFNELIGETYKDAYYANDFIYRAAYEAKRYDLVKQILERRVLDAPSDVQLRGSLATVYYESGDTSGSIKILEQAAKDFPDFKEQIDAHIVELEAGRVPKGQ